MQDEMVSVTWDLADHITSTLRSSELTFSFFNPLKDSILLLS